MALPDPGGRQDCLNHATVQLIAADLFRMSCLRAAASIKLPDWYIAAGFVRNLIWDHLHGFRQPTPLSDVDLLFFDPSNLLPEAERAAETALAGLIPQARWQVRNQARMHIRNGHAPYRDTLDAMRHFPELETGIGVRLGEQGKLMLGAPHGLACNWALTISPNPHTGYPASVTRARAAEKGWLHIWPRLRPLF